MELYHLMSQKTKSAMLGICTSLPFTLTVVKRWTYLGECRFKFLVEWPLLDCSFSFTSTKVFLPGVCYKHRKMNLYKKNQCSSKVSFCRFGEIDKSRIHHYIMKTTRLHEKAHRTSINQCLLVLSYKRFVVLNNTHIYVVRTSNNRVISIVACCRSVMLCAHVAWAFRSQHCYLWCK